MNSIVNSKCFSTYLLLDGIEKKQLKKRLKIELEHTNSNLYALLSYFIDKEMAIQNSIIEKETIYYAITGNKNFSDEHLRKIFSELLKKIENAIVWQELVEQGKDYNKYLFNRFKKKKAYKLAEQKIAEIENNNNSNFFSFDSYSWELEKYDLNINLNRAATTNEFILILNLFQEFVSTELLFIASKAISFKNELDITHHPQLETALNYFKTNYNIANPPSKIYYHLLNALYFNSDEHFSHFNLLINKYITCFPFNVLKELYLMAINFCIKKINNNTIEYNKIAYKLYIDAINNKTLLEDNELSRFSFTNIVTLAMKVETKQSVLLFIEDYQKYLSKEYRLATVQYNLCKVYIHYKEYSTALPILQTLQLNDILWNLIVKYMLVKILYEIN